MDVLHSKNFCFSGPFWLVCCNLLLGQFLEFDFLLLRSDLWEIFSAVLAMLKERVVEVKFAEGVVGEAIGACCADECDLSCLYVRLTSTAQFRNSNVGSIRAFFIDTARLLIALFQAPLPPSRRVHETDTRHRFLLVTVEIT